jgi:hypothetical protein
MLVLMTCVQPLKTANNLAIWPDARHYRRVTSPPLYPCIQTGRSNEFTVQQWMPRQMPAHSDHSETPRMIKNFNFSTSSRPAIGPTQPPIQWIRAVPSQGVERPKCECGHSLPISAEVKSTWIYTCTFPCTFMRRASFAKHRAKFIFTILSTL